MYGEAHFFLWFIDLFPPFYCLIGPPYDILSSKQPTINQTYNDQAM